MFPWFYAIILFILYNHGNMRSGTNYSLNVRIIMQLSLN